MLRSNKRRSSTPNTRLNLPRNSTSPSKSIKLNSRKSKSPVVTGRSTCNTFNRTDGRILTRVRKRHNSQLREHLNPKKAAEVVSFYLLPMMRNDMQNSKTLDPQTLGLFKGTSNLEPKEGTLLGNFQLVSELNATVDELTSKLKQKEDENKTNAQQKHSVESEHRELYSNYLLMQAENQNLNYENINLQREIFKLKQSNSFWGGQIKNYEETLKKVRKELERTKKQLETEKVEKEELEIRKTKLKYQNSLLCLKNDVVGDKLKGLYFAINNLVGSHYADQKLINEIHTVVDHYKALSEVLTDSQTQVFNLLKQKDEFQSDNEEFSKIYKNLDSKFEQFKKECRLRINDLNQRLKNSFTECHQVKQDYELVSKKHKETLEELRQLKTQLKKYKKKNEDEKKKCINCNLYFSEESNYNWSCKFHSMQFNRESSIYWCCGKQSEFAAGCKSSKHVSREDNEEDEDENQTQVEFCAACRSIGHSAVECPKDPNVKTQDKLETEVTRIKQIKKHSEKQDRVNLRLMELLRSKYPMNTFNVSSASSLSNKDEFLDFDDIYEIRNEIKTEPDLPKTPLNFNTSGNNFFTNGNF